MSSNRRENKKRKRTEGIDIKYSSPPLTQDIKFTPITSVSNPLIMLPSEPHVRLFEAIKKGDSKEVANLFHGRPFELKKTLLTSFVKHPVAGNEDEENVEMEEITPFYLACKQGNREILEAILEGLHASEIVTLFNHIPITKKDIQLFPFKLIVVREDPDLIRLIFSKLNAEEIEDIIDPEIIESIILGLKEPEKMLEALFERLPIALQFAHMYAYTKDPQEEGENVPTPFFRLLERRMEKCVDFCKKFLQKVTPGQKISLMMHDDQEVEYQNFSAFSLAVSRGHSDLVQETFQGLNDSQHKDVLGLHERDEPQLLNTIKLVLRHPKKFSGAREMGFLESVRILASFSPLEVRNKAAGHLSRSHTFLHPDLYQRLQKSLLTEPDELVDELVKDARLWGLEKLMHRETVFSGQVSIQEHRIPQDKDHARICLCPPIADIREAILSNLQRLKSSHIQHALFNEIVIKRLEQLIRDFSMALTPAPTSMRHAILSRRLSSQESEQITHFLQRLENINTEIEKQIVKKESKESKDEKRPYIVSKRQVSYHPAPVGSELSPSPNTRPDRKLTEFFHKKGKEEKKSEIEGMLPLQPRATQLTDTNDKDSRVVGLTER